MAQITNAIQLDDGRVEFKKQSPSIDATAGKSTHSTKESKIEAADGDTSIKKVNSKYSPRGKHGQKYLVSGTALSMRLWENEQPGRAKAKTQRPYETVGYVIAGRAELHVAEQKVLLEPGDSWVVPKDVLHQYCILEPFTAIEATYPPARIHGRDERTISSGGAS